MWLWMPKLRKVALNTKIEQGGSEHLSWGKGGFERLIWENDFECLIRGNDSECLTEEGETEQCGFEHLNW